MITLEHLNKSFLDKTGTTVILDDVSFTFPTTGFVCLCGRSGCGKSTLLKMIAGQINDYDGKILYDGVNYKNTYRSDLFYANNVYFLKYNKNFFENLTVKAASSFYLNKEEKNRFQKYLNTFMLESLLKKRIKALSSGELQKVSICFALSKRAKITILDEPVCNIDAKSTDIFLQEIKKLSEEVLVIYVSHFEKDIAPYYDLKVRLHEGKFSVEKQAESEKKALSLKVKKNFSFLTAIHNEVLKPQGIYMVFRIIFMLVLFVVLASTQINHITVGDVFYKNLTNMSVNLIDEKQFSNDYAAVKEKNIYKIERNVPLNVGDFYCLEGPGIAVTMNYYAKASDFKFANFSRPLADDEIIISDIAASNLKVKIGDTVKQRSVYATDYFLNYRIGYIYATDFSKYYKTLTETEDDKNEYKYQTVFLSDSLFEGLINDSLEGEIGYYLDNNIRLVTWKKEYDNGIYNDTLKDNEFCGDIGALAKYGFDMDFLFDGGGQTVNLTFTYKGISITKELVYKGFINYTSTLALSDKLYNEILTTFNLNRENILKSKKMQTIDVNAKDFQRFCQKELQSTDSLQFTNSSLITEKMATTQTKIAFINDNLIYVYFFAGVFLLISLYSIVKIEKNSYIMLKEKNFTVGNIILSTILAKLIFWVIALLIIIILSLNLKNYFL